MRKSSLDRAQVLEIPPEMHDHQIALVAQQGEQRTAVGFEPGERRRGLTQDLCAAGCR